MGRVADDTRSTGVAEIMTTKEMAEVADLMLGLARQAERRRQTSVQVPVRTLRRIADAVLEVVNREGQS